MAFPGKGLLRPEVLRGFVQGLAGMCMLLAVWQIAAIAIAAVRDVPFPTPLATLQRLGALVAGRPLGGHPLSAHILHSLGRWLAGVGIAAGCGIAYGLLAARSAAFAALFAPLPRLFLLVPGLAWIPVAILVFGIGPAATVFMIAAAAFAPVAVSVMAGIRGVDQGYVRAARMLGAGPGALFFRVLLPGALPHVISGLRIGCGTGWRVLVAAEMVVGTGTGLGYSIIQARWSLDYLAAFACIAVICAVGFFVEGGLLGRLEAATVRRWGVVPEKP